MNSLPLILFPYSHISDRDLQRISIHFDQLTIYRPWFMTDPVPSHQPGSTISVQVHYPPVHRKPKAGFKALLFEYRQWIRHHQDRSYSAFLRSLQEEALSEKSRWEIGGLLRRMNEDGSPHIENQHLNWHLVLHLAQEIMENRREEAEVLRELKHKKSPLEDALGEDIVSSGLFEDVPHTSSHPYLDDAHLHRVLEAWFGLFGDLLADHARLITLHPQVTDYVTEMIKDTADFSSDESLKSTVPHPAAGRLNLISPYQLPKLKNGGDSATGFMRTVLSEKTLILLAEE